MLKEISIGARKVALLANGATPLYFKQTFNKDLISKVYGSEDQIAEVNDCAPELAFIMAKQAEKMNNPAIKMEALNYEASSNGSKDSRPQTLYLQQMKS